MIEDSDEIKAQKAWLDAKEREDVVWDGSRSTDLLRWLALHEETERLLTIYRKFITPPSS